VVFYCKAQQFAIAGDVLFYRSIGRTDLPGGDHATLLRSIKTKMYALPNETIVHSGHGPQTTIGAEKIYNPFVNE
jgi:glyoxylase-like metal-dependent hydrolase (beta-lactamase superfamily II)